MNGVVGKWVCVFVWVSAWPIFYCEGNKQLKWSSAIGCMNVTSALRSLRWMSLTVWGFVLTFLQARILENYLSYFYDTQKIIYLLGNINKLKEN